MVKRQLSQQDWADAALTAIGEGGLAAVAVEPLATRLRTTKGSFYWHFANRDALIAAALALWEIRRTDDVISVADTAQEPLDRLRALFTRVVRFGGHDGVELALLATADHPIVAPVLARVTERRIDYVSSLYEQAGVEPAAARRRALLAITAWLGTVQLEHAVPGVLPHGADEASYLAFFLDTILP